jgi:predicted lipid-binding transport protein (Tim44 family)
MNDGFQFIDIILFAMVAAFLVLRLRSVLGRRDGHEGGKSDPMGHRSKGQENDNNVVQQLPDKSQPAEDEAPGIDKDNPLAVGILTLKAADPGFDVQEFLSGSRIAFEVILGAYASGDSNGLKSLLSPEVFANFNKAITDREQAGESMEDTLVGINKVDIMEAYMEDRVAFVTVKFISEQVNVVRDGDGEVVSGDANAVVEVTDFWTFSHDTKSRDPNWSLVATRSLD